MKGALEHPNMYWLSPQTKGILWKVLSCLCFASINGIVRSLSQSLPAIEIAFFQNLFGSLILLPWALCNLQNYSLKIRQDMALYLARAVSAAAGVFLYYTAFSIMPIAKVVSLGFLSPIIMILGARFFLREHLGWVRLMAIGLGIFGGICISHTSYFSGGAPWEDVGLVSLIPVTASVALAASSLIAKRLSTVGAPLFVTFSLTGMMTPILLIPTLWAWTTPTFSTLCLLLTLGGLAVGAHLSTLQAFSCADVTFLLPVGSVRLIASILIGFFFFSEYPSLWMIMGSVIILMALTILSRSQEADKSLTKAC